MTHTRNKTNIKAKLKKGAWKVVDDYTGFDRWSDEVTQDRVGFITAANLADKPTADDSPIHVPKQIVPDFVSAPGTPQNSDGYNRVLDNS